MSESTTSYDGSITMNRKLTEDETKELRLLLTHQFDVPEGEKDIVSDEDISDLLDYTLAMVSNGKSVDYAIQELINMEMDFCTSVTAHRIGEKLANFLKSLPPGVDEAKEKEDISNKNTEPNDDGGEGSRIISLKSHAEKGNALTMSGALGASRERKSLGAPDPFKKRGGGRDAPNNQSNRGGRAGRGFVRNIQNRNEDHNDSNQRSEGRGGGGERRIDRSRQGSHGGRTREVGGRSVVSAAFDRLTRQREDDRNFRQKPPSPRRERAFDNRDQRNDGPRNRQGGGGGGGGRGPSRGDGGGRGTPRGGRDGRRMSDARERDNRPPPFAGRDSGRGSHFGPGSAERNIKHNKEEVDFIPAGRGRGRANNRSHGDAGRGNGGPRISGIRRPREEDERESILTTPGRGGRFGGRDTRGRGRGGYDGGESENSTNKRPRTDYNEQVLVENEQTEHPGYEEYYEVNNYDEGYQDDSVYFQSYPGYRGRGFNGAGRGRGRGGHFNRTFHTPTAAEYEQNDPSTPANDTVRHIQEQEGVQPTEGGDDGVAGAVDEHPSPLVNAAFGGRGFGFPGRGRGRGRGRAFFPGRAEVVNMIASRSWVRPKPMEGAEPSTTPAGDSAPQS